MPQAPDQTVPQDGSPNTAIACLGDSITAGVADEEGLGWVARLSQKLAARQPNQYLVYNCGVSGDTTTQAWHNLLGHVTHLNPQILIIALGVNDILEAASKSESKGQNKAENMPRVSPIDRFVNWLRIFEYTGKMGWRTLVLGPLPVAGEELVFPVGPEDGFAPMFSTFSFSNAAIKEYNTGLKAFCESQHVPFLDVTDAWRQSAAELYTDGLHPNAAGHRLLATQIFDKLVQLKYV